MIATILTVAGALLGGGGIWGLLVKIGGWLGWRWVGSATALPLLGPVSHLATKLIDLVFLVLTWLIERLLKGADHISKNVYSFALVMLLVTIAWKFGPGDWRFWSARSIEPPAASRPAPRPPASRPAPRCSDPLPACWWDNLFR